MNMYIISSHHGGDWRVVIESLNLWFPKRAPNTAPMFWGGLALQIVGHSSFRAKLQALAVSLNSKRMDYQILFRATSKSDSEWSSNSMLKSTSRPGASPRSNAVSVSDLPSDVDSRVSCVWIGHPHGRWKIQRRGQNFYVWGSIFGPIFGTIFWFPFLGPP